MPDPKRFDPETASDSCFKARHHYQTLRSQEEMPEDPPYSLDFSIANAKSWKLMEKEKLEVWHLWEEDNIIAELFSSVGLHEDNQHLMYISMGVLQPYRKRGHSKLLLPRLVEMAERYNRTLVTFYTSSRLPAGSFVAEHLGATKGMEKHTNQLDLAEVDKALLESWINNTRTTAKDFEMGLWTGYPEEEIIDIAKMIEVMNTAPKDNLDVEEFKVDPEVLRQFDAYNKVRNIEFWMMYVRHKPSGELVGYTQTYYEPEKPENISQGDTGVLPKYRGHGLGKWLKAAMLQKVFTERPTAKRIRTGNADSNAPMLAINHALGFKPYISEAAWQIEVEKLKAYVQSKAV